MIIPLSKFEQFAQQVNATTTTWGNSNYRLTWQVKDDAGNEITCEFNSHLAHYVKGRSFYTSNVNDATHVLFDYSDSRNSDRAHIDNLHLTGKGSRNLELRNEIATQLILSVI